VGRLFQGSDQLPAPAATSYFAVVSVSVVVGLVVVVVAAAVFVVVSVAQSVVVFVALFVVVDAGPSVYWHNLSCREELPPCVSAFHPVNSSCTLHT